MLPRRPPTLVTASSGASLSGQHEGEHELLRLLALARNELRTALRQAHGIEPRDATADSYRLADAVLRIERTLQARSWGRERPAAAAPRVGCPCGSCDTCWRAAGCPSEPPPWGSEPER